MELKIPTIDKEGFDVLVSSVNKERLKNNYFSDRSYFR